MPNLQSFFRQQVLVSLALFIIISSCVEDDSSGPFSVQPNNKTVNYGEFIKFECRTYEGYSTLHLYLGAKRVYRSADNFMFDRLSEREIFADISSCHCSANETVGIIWILINNKTIPLVEFFMCRAVFDGQHADSRRGYINVKYPVCIPTQHSFGFSATIRPTSSLPTLLASSSLPTTPLFKFPHAPCPGNSNNYYSGVAVGLCLGTALLMIIVLFSIILCICVYNRHKLFAKSSLRSSTNQVCNNMVLNPIYDGPVYESVQPHFDSLVSQVNVTAADNAASKISNNTQCHNDLELSTSRENITEKNYYVSQPGIIQCGSISLIDDNEQLPTNRKLIQYNGECSTCTTELDEDKDCVMQQNKEDTYTVMNPAGTLTHSTLSGGLGEQTPET